MVVDDAIDGDVAGDVDGYNDDDGGRVAVNWGTCKCLAARPFISGKFPLNVPKYQHRINLCLDTVSDYLI